MAKNQGLTDARIRAATAAPGERLTLRDGQVPGLRVRVGNRKKAFVLIYRPAESREQRALTLGEFPTFSLAQAREEARQVLAGVLVAHWDPAARRAQELEAQRERREAETVAELALRYVEARRPHLSKKTIAEYRRIARNTVAPAPLGSMRITEVRRPHVREFVERIARENGRIMGNRVFQFVRAVFRWAVRQDAPMQPGDREVRPLLEHSPMDGLQLPSKQHPAERVLTDDEIRIVWATANDWSRPAVGVFAQLALLFGQRPTEIVLMRRSELDLGSRLWTIPGSRRKNSKTHAVPLAPRASEIIEAHMAAFPSDNDRVLKLDAYNHRLWWQPFRDACMAAGCELFTRRDLRRSVATGCGRLGVPRQTISLILGHTSMPGTAAVTAVYDWAERLDEVRAALEKWAVHVAAVTASAPRG